MFSHVGELTVIWDHLAPASLEFSYFPSPKVLERVLFDKKAAYVGTLAVGFNPIL
jgi:hypothetical protein